MSKNEPNTLKGVVSILLTMFVLLVFPNRLVGANVAELTVQQEPPEISGVIVDKDGVPIIGAAVQEVGTQNGVATDFDGKFILKLTTSNNHKIKITYIGFKEKTMRVKPGQKLKIVLEDAAETLDEVVLVSFGKQKKKSLVSSITTIKPKELKVPSSDLMTSFAGNIAGMVAYQKVGEPGLESNVDFFIRGVTTLGYAKSPLILIDGVELTTSDLSRLQPDDIASFSIMKDASATALYGARGANGVIYVTTKTGTEGKLRINVRFEESFSSGTYDLELADPITYMKLHNEAVRTRDPFGELPYTLEKVDRISAGENSVLFPVVDWYKELFEDYAINKRTNFSLSGGGSKVTYYVSGAISQDNGILKVPQAASYTNNIDLKKYQLRSNIGIKLTKNTQMKMNFTGSFDDYTGPIHSGSGIYERAMMVSPVSFRPYYEAKDFPDHPYTTHIMFGNDAKRYPYVNPYADLAAGYQEKQRTKFITQIEVNHNFRNLVKGLKAKAVLNINRESGTGINRQIAPFFYAPRENQDTKKRYLTLINPTGGRDNLDYSETGKFVISSTYLETNVNYSRKFNDIFDLGATLVGTMNHRTVSNPGSLQESLPYRNMGVSGRLNLGYNDRYLAELNFGYNGSERFAKKYRFGFFPAIGTGWVLSNEEFFKPLTEVVNLLKIKASYGLVGNDQIGSSRDRFFYLSQVNLNDRSKGFTTGKDFQKYLTGISVQREANHAITWEKSLKMDVGVELGLFDKLTLEADYFTEHRTDILMDKLITADTGLEGTIRANYGVVDSWGVDGSLIFNHTFGQHWWLQSRANFTYSTNKIVKYEEPQYKDEPWRSRIGHPVNQQWGLVAERLFVDDFEVKNSPKQTYGEYRGGDLKYKDINNDGRITDKDRVPMGYPTVPEIVYGFGFSTGFYGFDISCFFQGSANRSFWINARRVAPFTNVAASGWNSDNQLLKVWADSHWSESNRNIYAQWPRLSNYTINNNVQTSSWFMRDGSFLRLKSAEIGYSLPRNLVVDRWNMNKFRIYLSGTNLLVFSKFKLWDPEMGNNGLKYPIQRVFNFGIHCSL